MRYKREDQHERPDKEVPEQAARNVHLDMRPSGATSYTRTKAKPPLTNIALCVSLMLSARGTYHSEVEILLVVIRVVSKMSASPIG
jgi:hypothetical protein